MKKLLLRPKASEDIDEHFLRIAEDNPVIALEVVSSIEEALKRIQQHPEIGSPRYASTPLLKGIRMWPLTEFRNYLIFYLEHEDSLEVIRILYGTRDIPEALTE